jgi:hypothetical protein
MAGVVATLPSFRSSRGAVRTTVLALVLIAAGLAWWTLRSRPELPARAQPAPADGGTAVVPQPATQSAQDNAPATPVANRRAGRDVAVFDGEFIVRIEPVDDRYLRPPARAVIEDYD